MRIWTVGHSNQPLADFLRLLRRAQIETVADVRRYPGSRRHPHFGREQLPSSLHAHGLAYLHFPELGGRRAARKDSINTAWRSDAFRGYADYMSTPEFSAGIERLLTAAGSHRTAIMCAEALWWQCHRGLIADFLKSQGHEVLHILSSGSVEEHPYTSAASLVNGALSYRGLV